MSDRLERCRLLLDEAGVDGIVVSDSMDVRYLSGFRGEDATLLVTREAAVICTDARFWEQVHAEVTGFTLAKTSGELVAGTVAAAEERLGPAAALGFQGTVVSYADYRTLRRRHRGRLRDLRSRVSLLRVLKSETEVALMRRAAEITDAAVAAVVGRGLVGRSEEDVAWDLRAEYHRLGAEGEAFPAIVASGAHGAHAHALPGARVIASGELVVMDTGARVDGYCSDITRTFAAGQPTPGSRAIYDVVLEAQLAGLAATRAGAHGQTAVDAACRSVITAAGYADAFGHGTGHGVGLAVHEAPALGRTRGDRLEAGMVCTVEPGIYIEGNLGVRIEDTVFVTAVGCERLTRYPKELQVTA
jgi:Xaa-Pro aminopeptidase